MPYYLVESRLIYPDGEKETPFMAPAVDCLYRIIRYYRAYDKAFVIETDKQPKKFIKEIAADDPVVKSRIGWWEKCKPDADIQKTWVDNKEISAVKSIG